MVRAAQKEKGEANSKFA